MPPFKPKPPQESGLLIVFPRCAWCNVIGAHRCKGCDKYTCWNCLASYEGGQCEHFTYVPAETTGWGIDCVNPACDSDCNVCKGTGTIWSKAQLLLYAPQEVREKP